MNLKKRLEDGGKIGGSRLHFPVCMGGTPSQSSEKQSEQPMVSQHVWRLEAKSVEDNEKSDGKESASGQ